MKYRGIVAFVTGLLILPACQVDPRIREPLPSDNLSPVVPPGWPLPHYQFEENPVTEAGFVLGRALFYETLLSKDNSISCGSCHQNFVAFANAGHDVSHGVHPEILGTRNSPGLFNLAWHPSFMHDGSSLHIENQPLAPINNPIEMDETTPNVIRKLQETQKYRSLFLSAYGEETVTSQRMLRAMAQFMGLLYSYNSKFDHYKRGEKNVSLSEQELSGYRLFVQHCNSCHTEPLFSDFKFRNNGLAVNPAYNDLGRGAVTEEASDRYTFKTPSLRNIALTAPYMHDGRYETLEECLDHYTGRIENLENLDPLLREGIPLSAADKQDLIAFLRTLTDYEFINDRRFADPNYN